MELNEKIKKYRKEKGLSQEDLANKIFVSRTLITKYESGSAFPTQENLEKIADALEIEVKDLLSDEEKNLLVEKSYKANLMFWIILTISFALISIALILLSVIPYYEYSSYDYSGVTIVDPTPVHVTGYTSILATTLKVGNPISIIDIVFSVLCLVTSLLTFANLDIKILRILRIASIVFFVLSLTLFFASFMTMVSIASASDFQMNSRS